MNENETQVTVAASYSSDGNCIGMTVSIFGATITHNDIAETVKVLARPRQPRPHPDTTIALRTFEPNGAFETNGVAA